MTSSASDLKPVRSRKPTLRDVADAVGVSVMAVSSVVSGRTSTVRVSEVTRRRILEAIAELNYRPDVFARSLVLQRTGTVGFYSGLGHINTSDLFVREIFQAVALGLQENDQDVLIYSSVFKDRRSSLIDRVLSRKIDAIIALPVREDQVLIDALRKNHIPCVLIAEPLEGLKSVTADDIGGTVALATYLLGKGHRRFLYRRSAIPFVFEARRYQAFVSVVEAAGGQVIATQAREDRDSVTSEEAALISQRGTPDAVSVVVCWRDYSAYRVSDYCKAMHLHVPNDIAIAGFDGIADPHSTCDLTTVIAHWDQVARKATEMVNLLLGGAEIPDITAVGFTLHVGQTA